MAELVDALGSGPSVSNHIGVQVSFRVIILSLINSKSYFNFFSFFTVEIAKLIVFSVSIPGSISKDQIKDET